MNEYEKHKHHHLSLVYKIRAKANTKEEITEADELEKCTLNAYHNIERQAALIHKLRRYEND